MRCAWRHRSQSAVNFGFWFVRCFNDKQIASRKVHPGPRPGPPSTSTQHPAPSQANPNPTPNDPTAHIHKPQTTSNHNAQPASGFQVSSSTFMSTFHVLSLSVLSIRLETKTKKNPPGVTRGHRRSDVGAGCRGRRSNTPVLLPARGRATRASEAEAGTTADGSYRRRKRPCIDTSPDPALREPGLSLRGPCGSPRGSRRHLDPAGQASPCTLPVCLSLKLTSLRLHRGHP